MKKIILSLALMTYSCGGQEETAKTVDPKQNEQEQNDREQTDSRSQGDSFAIGAVPANFSSWEEINEVDPETRSITILDGVDPSGEICSIYLMAIMDLDESRKQFIVRTSFGHGNDSHKFFVVPQLTEEGGRSLGETLEDPGQIAMVFKGGNDFGAVEAVFLKWWHNDHFDINRCLNLVPRTPVSIEPKPSLTLPEGLSTLEEINEVDPSKTHLSMRLGYDPLKRAFGEKDECFVYLMAQYEDEQEKRFYYRTSFGHGDYTHPAFELKITEDTVDLNPISATHPTDSESFLRLTFLEDDLSRLDRITIKWLHGSHYHVDECLELRL